MCRSCLVTRNAATNCHSNRYRSTTADSDAAASDDTWCPQRGSHTNHASKLTSAVIDIRDFQRTRKEREIQAHLPEGMLVGIAGESDANPSAVFHSLDLARQGQRHGAGAWR